MSAGQLQGLASVLLVEGRDDREVVYQICNATQIDNRALFQVLAKDGFDAARDDFRVRLRGSVKTVGVVVDGDEDFSARWQSVSEPLRTLGYPEVPETLPRDGLVLSHDRYARAGVWIMPDNENPGILEDFIQMLIDSEDDLIGLASEAVANIPAEARRFKPTYRSKARVHTWLAWQEEPGTALGLAITKGYLRSDGDLLLRFAAWLQRLYVE